MYIVIYLHTDKYAYTRTGCSICVVFSRNLRSYSHSQLAMFSRNLRCVFSNHTTNYVYEGTIRTMSF